MATFLTIVTVLLALGAAGALVRGIVLFLQTSTADARRGETGPSASALGQNRMMWRRIQFQFLAVAAAVLLLLIAHPHAG